MVMGSEAYAVARVVEWAPDRVVQTAAGALMRVDAIAEVEVQVAGRVLLLDDVLVCPDIKCPVWSVAVAAAEHGWSTLVGGEGAEMRSNDGRMMEPVPLSGVARSSLWSQRAAARQNEQPYGRRQLRTRASMIRGPRKGSRRSEHAGRMTGWYRRGDHEDRALHRGRASQTATSGVIAQTRPWQGIGYCT